MAPVHGQQQRLEDRRDEILHGLQAFGLIALLQQGRRLRSRAAALAQELADHLHFGLREPPQRVAVDARDVEHHLQRDPALDEALHRLEELHVVRGDRRPEADRAQQRLDGVDRDVELLGDLLGPHLLVLVAPEQLRVQDVRRVRVDRLGELVHGHAEAPVVHEQPQTQDVHLVELPVAVRVEELALPVRVEVARRHAGDLRQLADVHRLPHAPDGSAGPLNGPCPGL